MIFNNIPSNWSKIQLKYIGNLYGGLSGKSGDDFYDEEHPLSRPYINFKNIAKNSVIDINLFDVVKITKDENQNIVSKNDLFFLMSSENYDDIGKTAILLEDVNEYYLNSFCKGFRLNSNRLNAKFLNYLLSADNYRKQLAIEANGYTRINLQIGKINDFVIHFPENLNTQIRIAEYLDQKTAEIDVIIEKKEKLLILLEEKKKAIINEAVTKGLNPNVTMKDSGIEWIGEIPEHWEMKKFKYLLDFVESGCSVNAEDNPIEFESEYGVLKTSCVYNYSFDYTENKKVFKEEYNRVKCPVKENTIIVSRMNTPDLVGASGYVDNSFSNIFLPDRLWQLNFIPDYQRIVKFVSFVLSSEIYKRLYSRISTGSSPSMKNISQNSYLDIDIALPPQDECVKVLYFIQKSNDNINLLKGKLSNQIEKLKEYRQSLISEAVTGRIEI